MANTLSETHRFFRVDPAAYTALTDYVDNSRGYPNKTTKRGLPLFEWLVKEEDGWGLIPIDKWRFTDEDEVVGAEAIEDGTVEEIGVDTYVATREAILNPPEPEPEEPEEDLVPPGFLPLN